MNFLHSGNPSHLRFCFFFITSQRRENAYNCHQPSVLSEIMLRNSQVFGSLDEFVEELVG